MKLIKTSYYLLLVSDEEIQNGDVCYYKHPRNSSIEGVYKIINKHYPASETSYAVYHEGGWIS